MALVKHRGMMAVIRRIS